MIKVAVLISGRGSNLEALIKDQNKYQITHVITNKAEAKGLKIAQRNGINNTYINWSDRRSAEKTLINLFKEIKVELIVLAGFMRILSPTTVKSIPRTINIHPSLLPKYPGLNTHQKVIAHKDITHGATVHVVDDQLDSGLILGQISFSVDLNMSAEQLAAELILKEHKLLTTVVGLIANNQLSWEANNLYNSKKQKTKPVYIDD